MFIYTYIYVYIYLHIYQKIVETWKIIINRYDEVEGNETYSLLLRWPQLKLANALTSFQLTL